MTTGEAFPNPEDNLETVVRKTVTKQAEIWLRLDALFLKASELFGEWKAKMSHWADRGPRDYEDADKESLRELVRNTVRATVEIQGGYHEGGNGSSPQWRNWVMTLLGTLVAIGITGLIVMYANEKAMGERMDGFERRISNIEHKLWP